MLKAPKIKVLELFGGIGAPRKALENLGFDVKTIDYVEIWPWAVKGYNLIFNNNFNTQDVKTWNLDIDLLFHGSPCQDWSNAGKQDLSTGRSLLYKKTLEIIKKLNPKPKYIIWENVLGLISKKHKQYFDIYLNELENLGYTNTWKVLNAKDFGIPQSRNRVFVISIRNDINQTFNFDNLKTKEMQPLLNFINIHETDSTYFIKSQSMQKAVAAGRVRIINDFANTVTTKQDRWNNAGALAVPLIIKKYEQGKVKVENLTSFNTDNYVTLTDQDKALVKTLQSNNRCKIAVPINNQGFNSNGKTNINLNDFMQESYVYDSTNPNTTVGTITTNIKQSKIAIPIQNECLEIKEYQDSTNFLVLPRNSDGAVINGAYNRVWKISKYNAYTGTVAASNPLKVAIPVLEVNKNFDYKMSDGSKRPIGQINKEGKITIPITNNHSQNKIGVSVIPTITTNGNVKVIIPAISPIPEIPIFIIDSKPYHLRILTPKETWLLMGFTNNDFEKVKDMPKTHLYHMAGNSIVVPVLEAIFSELLKDWNYEIY